MTSSEQDEKPRRRSAFWLANNSVVANILMLIFIVGGISTALKVRQEVWPHMTRPTILIKVAYPGASPDEVEQEILAALEAAVGGVSGISNIDAIAYDGLGKVALRLNGEANPFEVFQDVQGAVATISTFPEQAEPPEINILEGEQRILSLLIYGKQSHRALRELADKIQDDLRNFSGIGGIRLGSIPKPEISIEIPLAKLRLHNLTLDAVSDVINQSSVNLPGGEVLEETGRVLLRTRERRGFGQEFLNLPITTSPSGSLVTLGELANVRDGLEESDSEIVFDGFLAVPIEVYGMEGDSPQRASNSVREYLVKLKDDLPANIRFKVWQDSSIDFTDRIEQLRADALLGLFLVLVLLGLFLEIRLAFWITATIPTSMFGAFLLIQYTDVSINMVSLFAFIIALGIVIDYAVVVGENIYKKREGGLGFLEAAQSGVQQLFIPILFAVCTNIIAFLPLHAIPGANGKVFAQIPIILSCVILVSGIVTLFILPWHLSRRPTQSWIFDILNRPKIFVEQQFRNYLAHIHVPILNFVLAFRYLVLAGSTLLLLAAIGLLSSGYFTFSLLPKTESNSITVQAELPFGVSLDQSKRIRDLIINAAKDTGLALALDTNSGNSENGLIEGIYAQIGSPTNESTYTNTSDSGVGSHLVGVTIALVPPEERSVSTAQFVQTLRQVVGKPIEIKRLHFNYMSGESHGPQLEVHLSHTSRETLESASKEMYSILNRLPGVIETDSGIPEGKRRLDFHLSPNGRSLGITAQSLGLQIRSAFYGTQAFRQQRGKEKLRVMLRLPLSERKNLSTLHGLIIRTPLGGEVPLSQAASFEENTSYISLQRRNGSPTLTVTANIDEKLTRLNQVVDTIELEELPRLIKKYPGLSYSVGGESEASGEVLAALRSGFITISLVVYCILAIALKSYTQPLIILISIPFGIIGALVGHVILGYDPSVSSLFGILSLSGVLLNNSLLLVITANELREERSFSPLAAIRQAEILRFRPIFLTALTTFLSVLPLILETTPQSKAIIPMAISLGFGVLFASVITLAIVPALYLIFEDRHRIKRVAESD